VRINRKVNSDTAIVEVIDAKFSGVRLVTREEFEKGWQWDGPWIEQFILNTRRKAYGV
jgi:hypothetical protein